MELGRQIDLGDLETGKTLGDKEKLGVTWGDIFKLEETLEALRESLGDLGRLRKTCLGRL